MLNHYVIKGWIDVIQQNRVLPAIILVWESSQIWPFRIDGPSANAANLQVKRVVVKVVSLWGNA